ncbi:alanine racemase [Salibaculum griseiflavum]|uniref:alanine racemase n=2 Tax=Salibaculum griseiflavum TaxID=1914409 RepID=A0A2V1P392_9RHOB|nr:alanine racemase [Salibaculum griseiflavum]
MMPDPAPTSWCTIHRDRIARNLDLALGLVPTGRRFCAVLKADAYGHGIEHVVPLVRDRGVTCIGITSNAEARAVRAAGYTGSLIRLRVATPQEAEEALPDHVEEQVSTPDMARHLRALRDAGRLRTGVHLALNVAGMSRDGLEIESSDGRDACRLILDLLGVAIRGICTHFPSNLPGQLRESADLFQAQAAWVVDAGGLDRRKVLVHAGSSLTLTSDTTIETDMYRCGAVLYGILRPDLGYRPTMDLETRVVGLQTYPRGASVGYDRTVRLTRDSRLACLSIGYENGFGRIASGAANVAIAGNLAPVLGKVSMNAIVADVTDLPQVQLGDTAVVFGGSGSAAITPEMAERQFDTIMADLYTDWGRRNARIHR